LLLPNRTAAFEKYYTREVRCAGCSEVCPQG